MHRREKCLDGEMGSVDDARMELPGMTFCSPDRRRCNEGIVLREKCETSTTHMPSAEGRGGCQMGGLVRPEMTHHQFPAARPLMRDVQKIICVDLIVSIFSSKYFTLHCTHSQTFF